MNNGRYLTIFDLGRFDLMLRMGLAGPARKNGWLPVLSCANVIFRRELRLFQKFHLETRILWWSGTQFVMEHRALLPRGDDEPLLSARALMIGGLYDRANRRFVPVTELMASMGVSHEPPPVTPEIEAVLQSAKTLRDIGAANTSRPL